MAVFPNVDCVIEHPGEPDMYGQLAEGSQVRVKCSVVKLERTSEKSSVFDTSASRGNANEVTAAARLLFLPPVEIGLDDIVVIQGIKLKVVNVHTRFDVFGRHDHNQVDLDAWA
jgi:hypothetical protein